MAITWKDVIAPNFSGANMAAANATQTIDRGLGQLTRLAQGLGDENNQNWEQQKKLNTDALLGKVQQLNSLEDLNAAKASGQFDLGKYGAQVNSQAIRNAVDSRDNEIMADINTSTDFANQQRAEADKPLLARLNTEALNVSNQAGVNKLIEEAKTQGLSDEGTLSLAQKAKTNLDSNMDTAYKLQERVREEENRNATKGYGTMINSLVGTQTNEADGIAALNAYARDKNLTPAQRADMFDSYKSQYSAINELTNEEKAVLAKNTATAMQNRDSTLAQAQAKVADVVRNVPTTNPVKSWDDSFKKGDAVKAILEKSPVDQINQSNLLFGKVGADGYKGVWFSGEDAASELTKLMNSEAYKDVNPNIIKEAIDRTAAEKGAIYFPTLYENIDATIRDYSAYLKGDSIRKQAENEFLSIKKEADTAYDDFTSGMLSTIQNTKKLKNAAATIK